MFYPYWRSAIFVILLLLVLGSEASAQPSSVKIAWNPNPEVRVTGYNVYRSTEAGKGFGLLNREGPLMESSYVDASVQKGFTYHYVVTSVDLHGLESRYSTELVIPVQKPAPAVSPVFLPVSLPTDHPGYQNTFVGIGLLNLGNSPDQVGIDGVNQQGAGTGFHLLSQLAPTGRSSYLTDQMGPVPSETVSTVARTNTDVHGFFMAGSKDLRSFDGVTGTYERAKLLYFPIAVRSAGQSTYISLFNPNETLTAEIDLLAFSSSGTLAAKQRVSVPAFGTFRATLDQAFGDGFALEDGYLKASSSVPVSGFEFYSVESKSLSAIGGLAPAPSRQLVLPQFFIDDSGGETQLRLINPEDKAIQLEIRLYVDGSKDPVVQKLQLQPAQMALLSARKLLGLEGRPAALSGYLEVSGTRIERGEAVFTRLIGGAFFQANQGNARTATPLERGTTEKWIFPVVMQSRQSGYFTGLALLNPLRKAISVTLRAFDDAGKLTGEKIVTLKAGERLARKLDDAFLLGEGFSQVGGHFELAGSGPFHALALFADQKLQFLSDIGPVEK